MRTFRTILHKLLKLNNLSAFHVEQLIGVSAFRRSTWNNLSAFRRFGVPRGTTYRRFSPRFLAVSAWNNLSAIFAPLSRRFGVSAVRVGRRSAESRVAPNNFPDPLATCRRSAETLPPIRRPAYINIGMLCSRICRRNADPPIRSQRADETPKNVAAESLYRRFDTCRRNALPSFRRIVESPNRRIAET